VKISRARLEQIIKEESESLSGFGQVPEGTDAEIFTVYEEEEDADLDEFAGAYGHPIGGKTEKGKDNETVSPVDALTETPQPLTMKITRRQLKSIIKEATKDIVESPSSGDEDASGSDNLAFSREDLLRGLRFGSDDQILEGIMKLIGTHPELRRYVEEISERVVGIVNFMDDRYELTDEQVSDLLQRLWSVLCSLPRGAGTLRVGGSLNENEDQAGEEQEEDIVMEPHYTNWNTSEGEEVTED